MFTGNQLLRSVTLVLVKVDKEQNHRQSSLAVELHIDGVRLFGLGLPKGVQAVVNEVHHAVNCDEKASGHHGDI